MLTTTFNLLSQFHCDSDCFELLKSEFGTDYQRDKPITLIQILETCGPEAALLALRATSEDSNDVSRLMAVDFAESMLPIWEKEYPYENRAKEVIEVARRFANHTDSGSNMVRIQQIFISHVSQLSAKIKQDDNRYFAIGNAIMQIAYLQPGTDVVMDVVKYIHGADPSWINSNQFKDIFRKHVN